MAATMKAAYITLGCKLNFAETSTVGRLLASRGVARAQGGEEPDVVVVNTCSVTEVADRKCRQAIRAVHRRHPGAAIVVTGCYAQLKPQDVAGLPGVAIVAGNNEKDRLADLVDALLHDRRKAGLVLTTPAGEIATFAPSCARGDRTRFFLKVQDGCDYRCSYCTIPRARGGSRSPSVESLVEQARQAAGAGGREIVLTGVNTGCYRGPGGETLFDLCRALDAVEGIDRYRISSIEPNLLTDDLIRWVGTESRAFMPHFHVPLQSGSDTVLGLMRRRYNTRLYASKVEAIRRWVPDAFIGVDLIVGMRGETPELFAQSERFVEGLDVSRLHVFAYSERPGTDALAITPAVSPEERHERSMRMTALSDRKLAAFTARFSGTRRPVLLEHALATGGLTGHTDNYLPVTVGHGEPNTIVEVILP